jgi:hypothetical protein
MRLEITAKMLGDDDTFSWGTYFAYWRLRTDVNQFLKDCVSAGTTHGTLAVIDRMSATISEAKLMKRAYNLDMTILDILNNLLPSMKQAELSGDYKGLIDLFQPSHPALDQTGASAHPKAHYLIALRLDWKSSLTLVSTVLMKLPTVRSTGASPRPGSGNACARQPSTPNTFTTSSPTFPWFAPMERKARQFRKSAD